MAAVLKKRVLAEYTSQTIQEEEHATKRLRLVYKPADSESRLQLQTSQTPTQLITSLLQYEQRLPTDAVTAESDIRDLLSHCDRERNDTVRFQIVAVVRTLAKIPGVDSETLVENIMSLLKNEKSHKVRSQLIKTLETLGSLLPSNNTLHTQLITAATQWLNDSYFGVRVSCLELISILCPLTEKRSDESVQPIQQLLGHHAKDPDSRVRAAALRAMLTLHERGILLDQAQYDVAANCLNDDLESVRLVAVKLLWVMCQVYPDRPAAGSDSFNEVTLLDDGFVKICNTINDVSCLVRTEAAGLLGSLHNVSPRFLRQTLDKKLMSSMRKKMSAHERARESYVSGEWATGQKWASDAPREEVNPDDISLMNIGACGAFVHGLEDEFLEVRNAALDSLCELASQNPMFAVLTQDSIIDMFNDEIESVRLNAINSLRKISSHIVLREDQLEIILGVLQDLSPVSRESLREMLGDMKLGTKACLTACVMALLDNLTRYPQDKQSVLRLMQRFGEHHPDLTSAILPDVLCIHPYFATPEPDMQDPNYMSILVMVLNAAAKNPTMLALFQEHTWTHYHFLRSSLPHLIPQLLNERTPSLPDPGQPSPSVRSASLSYISATLASLRDLPSMDLPSASQLLNITIRDLNRMDDIVAGEVSSAECISLYLSTQVSLLQLLRGSEHFNEGNHGNTLINKILRTCDEIKHVYVGLGCAETVAVRETELKALGLRAASQPVNCSVTASSIQSVVSNIYKLLNSSDLSPDPFTDCLHRYFTSQTDSYTDSVHCDLASLLEKIRAAIPLIKPRGFSLTNHIHRISAKIFEPTGSLLDKPIKFTAGMTTSISLEAVVENATNLSDVRIQVCYPDMHTDYTAVATKDVTKLSPMKRRIRTQVILSHSLTSDAFEVELCLVLLPRSSLTTALTTAQSAASETDHTKLCKAVKVSLAPKSSKR